MNSLTAPPRRAHIAFGIAGWSYPDWDGIVYPRGTMDKLGYVARYVDLIEINSTFYRPAAAKDAAAWCDRVADYPRFYFTAKLHRDITHGGRLEPVLVRQIREGLAPLVQAGRLRHLLAQFRFDFADTPPARAHLQAVRSAFEELTHVTLELRHGSWQKPEALASLEGVTVANLDYPLARNSFNLRLCTVGADRYLRLHGRNAAAWFSRDAGRDETYNYSYSERELEEIGQRALALAESAQSLTVVANNHFQGQALANVLQLKAKLTGQRLPVPPGLLVRYPALADCSSTGQ